MFGILAPCRARTPETLLPRWMGHFCGLCLELRDSAGQFARFSTNYDTLALSVLVEAQRGPAGDERTAGPCALRGMRRQRIATGDGPRLAAAASLLLTSAKLQDHVDDGDGLAAHRGFGGLTRKAADTCRAKAAAVSASIGLPVDRIADSIDRQKTVEAAAGPGTPFDQVSAPTEEATAVLFAHAAALGAEPDNAVPFARAGRAFGRLAHLLDAAEDLAADAERGAWNPLAATGTPLEDAEQIARTALWDMRAALETAAFVDATMVRLLLERYAEHAVGKVFGNRCATAAFGAPDADPRSPGRPKEGEHSQARNDGSFPRGFWAGLCPAVAMLCTCQYCCADEYHDPWSGKQREGCCRGCDCDGGCCECRKCCGDGCCDCG